MALAFNDSLDSMAGSELELLVTQVSRRSSHRESRWEISKCMRAQVTPPKDAPSEGAQVIHRITSPPSKTVEARPVLTVAYAAFWPFQVV